MSQRIYSYFTWGIVLVLLSLAVFSWGNAADWAIGSLSIYQWFPLFGLVAWLTMATHYYTGVFRILNPTLKKPVGYKPITSYLVLASLLLHPGLLAYAQASNGAGIPPQSFIDYVGEGLQLAVMLGSFSLVLFLSFEVFELIQQKRVIQKYWWAVSISQSLAMTLIWVHGFRLGSHLGEGWFQAVWILCGLALLPCFYIIHNYDFRSNRA